TARSGDRSLRRIGLLLAHRRSARSVGRDAVRLTERQGRARRDRREKGRIFAASRQRSSLSAADDQLSRESLGDEGAGREVDRRAYGGRLSFEGLQAGIYGGLRP